MKYILAFIFILTSIMVKSQVISIDNGFSYTTTKYESRAKCSHDGYSVFISLDYLQNKYYYVSSRIGYLSTGYFEYSADYVGNVADSHKFISDDLHLSTTFRGKIPINNIFIYAGLGPKMDFSFNKRKTESYECPSLNDFKNIFGVKFDLGICMDLDRIRLGLNTAYLSNLNSGEFNTNKYICDFSVGYIF